MYNVPENMKLSKNFSLSEFVCKDGSNEVLVDYELIDGLQDLRDYLNLPVTITPNGGYRTEKLNADVGGIDDSEHTKGKAGDVKVSGKTPLQIAQVAYKRGKFRGIGVYPTFTHLDVGAKPFYWKQDTNGKKTFFKSFSELEKAVK